MLKSFTTGSGALASAVKYTARWLAPKPTSPAHAGLLFSVTDGILSVSGFNENATARATLAVDGEASGDFVVAGRLIDALVATFPNKPITFEQNDSVITVTSGRFAATLPAMSEKDYPTLPGQSPVAGTVDGASLADAVHRVGAAARRDVSSQIALCGILVSFDEDPETDPANGGPIYTLTFTATDRYRAARKSVRWTPDADSAPIGESALVLASLLVDGVEAFVGLDAVTIGWADGSFSLTTPTRSLVTRVLPKKDFPGMQILFDTPVTAAATIRVKDLALPLKRADLLKDRDTDAVRLNFTAGMLTIAVASEMSGADEEVDITYDGPDATIVVKSATLQGALAHVPGDTVVLAFIPGTFKPVVVTSPTDPTWRHILVPLRKVGGQG